VKVFNGRTFQEMASFLAYDAGFHGGVFVAAGDVNGDGKADIITGAGAGAAPHVMVFNGATLQVLASYLAYDAGFAGGVRVAVADVNGDGKADIITSPGFGSIPEVKVFDGATFLQKTASYLAYDAGFVGGVFVAATDVNGDGKADIITGADSGAGPHVKVLSGLDGTVLFSFLAFGGAPLDGVFVAAGST
jgi:serralysin